MPKKLSPGICVHCGKHVKRRTWDHVFPRGWYPDDTPKNLEKWKIPACRPCNEEYGQIEEQLGIVIPLCLGPDAQNARGMYRKALRALDPSAGRNYKDKLRRQQKKEKLLAEMLKADQIPTEGAYPGLEERWNRPKPDQVALLVPAKHLERLVDKIVKGITYIESGRILDGQTEIKHHVVTSTGAAPIESILAAHGEVHSREPGIEVTRAVAPEDGVSALYKIAIWGEFVLYASVIRNPTQQNASVDAQNTARP